MQDKRPVYGSRFEVYCVGIRFTVYRSPFTELMDSFFKLSYDPALYIDDAFNKLNLSDELPNTTLLMEIQ